MEVDRAGRQELELQVCVAPIYFAASFACVSTQSCGLVCLLCAPHHRLCQKPAGGSKAHRLFVWLRANHRFLEISSVDVLYRNLGLATYPTPCFWVLLLLFGCTLPHRRRWCSRPS
jgi:hypothetical protein